MIRGSHHFSAASSKMEGLNRYGSNTKNPVELVSELGSIKE
jgi:hypothetical protein